MAGRPGAMAMPPEKLLTVKEVADLLGTKYRRVLIMIKGRKLRTVTKRPYMISQAHLQKFLGVYSR